MTNSEHAPVQNTVLINKSGSAKINSISSIKPDKKKEINTSIANILMYEPVYTWAITDNVLTIAFFKYHDLWKSWSFKSFF